MDLKMIGMVYGRLHHKLLRQTAHSATVYPVYQPLWRPPTLYYYYYYASLCYLPLTLTEKPKVKGFPMILELFISIAKCGVKVTVMHIHV